MTDPAEGSHRQSEALVQSEALDAGTARAFPPALRKVWTSPRVITGTLSGTNAAFILGSTVNDGVPSYSS